MVIYFIYLCHFLTSTDWKYFITFIFPKFYITYSTFNAPIFIKRLKIFSSILRHTWRRHRCEIPFFSTFSWERRVIEYFTLVKFCSLKPNKIFFFTMRGCWRNAFRKAILWKVEKICIKREGNSIKLFTRRNSCVLFIFLVCLGFSFSRINLILLLV